MFNNEADKSVTCDECCDNEQDYYYCMFVSIHIYFDLIFPYTA